MAGLYGVIIVNLLGLLSLPERHPEGGRWLGGLQGRTEFPTLGLLAVNMLGPLGFPERHLEGGHWLGSLQGQTEFPPLGTQLRAQGHRGSTGGGGPSSRGSCGGAAEAGGTFDRGSIGSSSGLP